MNKKFKIKKGDSVIVIAGKDKGKSGNVLSIIKDKDRVVVQGVNIIKRLLFIFQMLRTLILITVNQQESSMSLKMVSRKECLLYQALY